MSNSVIHPVKMSINRVRDLDQHIHIINKMNKRTQKKIIMCYTRAQRCVLPMFTFICLLFIFFSKRTFIIILVFVLFHVDKPSKRGNQSWFLPNPSTPLTPFFIPFTRHNATRCSNVRKPSNPMCCSNTTQRRV